MIARKIPLRMWMSQNPQALSRQIVGWDSQLFASSHLEEGYVIQPFVVEGMLNEERRSALVMRSWERHTI